jgi:hypothetical protein
MKIQFNEIKPKSKSVCVVDNVGGSYLPIAHRLSEHFDKVYYHSVNQNPFPRMALDQIGKGYSNIERVDEFWKRLDEFDTIVFPDIYFNDWGAHLRKIGKQVWGGTEAEQLETDRQLFKTELKNVGLMVAPTKYIKGVDNLVKELKQSKDKWIKLSYYRGEGETARHIKWSQSEIMIDNLNYEMGPLASVADFCLEDHIDSIAEIGYDGWCVNGQFTKGMIWGLEVKDCGYIGKASNYTECPAPVKMVNDKFSPVLQKYGHTGFYSTEVRYAKDGNTYYTDPCVRSGSPPSNVYMKMIDNWNEIITNGSKGQMVEPKFNSKYGVEIILKSNYCNSNTLPVMIPDEYKNNVALKGAYSMNGKDYVIPFNQAGIKDMEAFGSVVVVGDDLDEIMNEAIKIAGSVEAPGVYYAENALDKAKNTLMELKNNIGVEF